jgi:hypothetical protein
MSRNGSGTYQKPSGTTAVSDTAISSYDYNRLIDDIIADLNTQRPISAGGTGAVTAEAARASLGVEIGVDVASFSALDGVYTAGGLTFNPVDFIRAEVGGDAEADKIFSTEADALTQDRSIITAGIQKSLVAAYKTGANFLWLMPNGRYCLNGELTDGEYETGVTLAQHIASGGQDNSTIGADQFPTLDFGNAQIFVDGSFVSASQVAGDFIDKCIGRFEPDAKDVIGPRIKNLFLYWHGDEADRWKCPTGIKIENGNFTSLENITIRGSNYDWPGDPIHLAQLNNSRGMRDWSIKGGTSLTAHDMPKDVGLFDIEADGGTDGMVIRAQAGTPFEIPSGEASTYFDGLYVCLGEAASTSDALWVKVASRLSDDALLLDASRKAPANITGINVSFQRPQAAMTLGSNVLTFSHRVLHADMTGRRIMVRGVGQEGNSNKGNLSAYIKPGSISVDLKSCQLVEKDGVTPANAAVANAAAAVEIGASMFLGQIQGQASAFNNELDFHDVSFEKGAPVILEHCFYVNFNSAKFHGRAGTPALANANFVASGANLILDACPMVAIDGVEIDYTFGFDPVTEAEYSVDICGSRTVLMFDRHRIYGGTSNVGIFNFEASTGPSSHVVVGDGVMNINSWGDIANSQKVAHLGGDAGDTYANRLRGTGDWINSSTGTASGPEDLMKPYKNNNPVADLTIASGVIEVNGTGTYLIETGVVGVADLTDISGGVQANRITIRPKVTGENIRVVSGAIHLAANADKTMTQRRDSILLEYLDGTWREVGAL